MGSKAGRKRKAGARTKSGRLSRAGICLFDRGTDHTQAMQALYGTDGCDAIGRAYRTGLLGVGNEAKAMLDMARRVSNAYWRSYSAGTYKCALGDRTGGSVVSMDSARDKRTEDWLNEQIGIVTAIGHPERRAFYQLAIDINPDCGPPWLDRICEARRTNCSPAYEDGQWLKRALDALSVLVG